MCGIAGAVGPNTILLAAEAGQITERLRHRGPDATGRRDFGYCSLGHTRLRIIDLSPRGDQPLANEDENVWAVFNGEIYNFGELRTGLETRGHRFRSQTDTEVLVHLYEEHGIDMARYLHGMFAFAIWDDRRRQLMLCRDRLGIKPLYYRMSGDRISFASEVQALTRPGDTIDPAALYSYLRLGWIAGPNTIRSNILELLPGHRLVLQDGREQSTSYWSPNDDRSEVAPTADELGEALLSATRRHLVADVPVGVFLSSGIDSTIVARLGSNAKADLRTYTVAFGSAMDESTEAAVMAQRLGLPHTVVTIGPQEAIDSVGPFMTNMDQPTVDGMNSWIVSRAVRDAGSLVALSGLGGDELFAGYSTFRHIPRLVGAGKAGGDALPWGRAAAAMGSSGRIAHSRARRALEAIKIGGWGPAYEAVRGLFGQAELDTLWPRGRESKVGLAARVPSGERRATAVVGLMELTNYLPFQLLRDTDCMSMAHALEVRVPLLDDAIVELALRGQRSGVRWSKRQLVEAVDPSLAYLLNRTKRTFTLPIDEWMRTGLHNSVEEALVLLGDSGIGFDRRQLTDVWSRFLAGQIGWRPIWALGVLGMWLDRPTTSLTPTPLSTP
ncbi:MAG: asparagine synthase (glutamine-hydrolyzing) [Actinomycetota bacterium]|nr:asparagine synthase (glutamine-hydrolyzing) [Actinomycetota bacterium]